MVARHGTERLPRSKCRNGVWNAFSRPLTFKDHTALSTEISHMTECEPEFMMQYKTILFQKMSRGQERSCDITAAGVNE